MPTINDLSNDQIVNTREKTILCIDNGMFVGFCRTLSRYFKKVMYFCEYRYPFPSFVKYMIGYGFDEMERVKNLWDAIDKADVIFFPDVYYGDLAVALKKMGKRIYGSNKAEELEINRTGLKKYMKSVGLPVNGYREIKGLDKLREYLKENDEKYIKTDYYRWDFESFHHTTYNLSEPFLDNLEHKLGPAKHIYKFLVEDMIDGDDVVEGGDDFLTVDGEFSKWLSVGYEIKCEMYATKFIETENAPRILTDVNKAIAPALKAFEYRGPGCTEIRIKNGKPYMIDFTARLGSPPAEIQQEAITNWGDIIWYGSEGMLIEPEVKYKFGVQFFILSGWAVANWQSVYFPKEIDRWVKLRNSCKINGTNWVVPTESPIIGNVAAVGDSIEECFEQAKERAEQISGYEVEIKTGAIDQMKEIMAKGEKSDINIK